MTVDDDPLILKVEKKILVQAGHEVITAASGKEALEKLETVRPDLILLDVMMPGLDGWQPLELIRKQDALKDVPVSMLTVKRFFTSFPDVGDLDSVEELVHYIHKPFTVESLTNDVNKILEGIESLAEKKEDLSSKIEDEKAVTSFLFFAKKERLHNNLLATLKESLKNESKPDMVEHIKTMIAEEEKSLERFRKHKKEIEDMLV